MPEHIGFANEDAKSPLIPHRFDRADLGAQDVLDFCAEHDVSPHIQIININDINDAFDKMVDGDVRFRYVIDNSTLTGVEA